MPSETPIELITGVAGSVGQSLANPLASDYRVVGIDVAEEHGDIPYVLLHLAGLYDDETAVRALTQQIARIYERDFMGYLYSGDPQAGQAMSHRDDMIDAFRRTIERRSELPDALTVLAGEPETMSYQQLQDTLGRLIHGEDWTTISVPQPLAKAGAWLQGAAEPLVPDAIDEGKKPFVRPFMIEISSDHYQLDISRARERLGCWPVADAGLGAMVYNVNFPWNLLLCLMIGIWLMCARLTVGTEGAMANADHLIGALVVTVSVTALAEMARPVGLLNIAFGAALLVVPFVFATSGASMVSSLACGVALIALSIRRGPVRQRYGGWNRLSV